MGQTSEQSSTRRMPSVSWRRSQARHSCLAVKVATGVSQPSVTSQMVGVYVLMTGSSA